MEINKSRKNLISTILLLALLSGTFVLGGTLFSVFAPDQNTGYLEEGIYPSAASYTIWISGSTYYAKDAYGHIPSWGESSNATAIYESARDNITGGTIYFKAGTYIFDSALWLENNTYLIGEGIENTFFVQDSGSDLPALIRAGSSFASIYGQHNITLRDFSVYGGQGGSESNVAISFHECTHITIENVNIYHAQSSGLWMAYCEYVFLKNLYGQDISENQAFSFNGLHNSVIDGLIAVNCSSYGIDFSYVTNTTISNLLMMGENTTLKVDLGVDATEVCDRLTITNIQVYAPQSTLYNGIQILHTYNSSFSNFNLVGGYLGFRVGNNSRSLTFSNGYVSGGQNGGIYVRYGDNILLQNIIVFDAGGYALLINADANRVTAIGIDSYYSGNYIRNLDADSHVNLCWNATSWVS